MERNGLNFEEEEKLTSNWDWEEKENLRIGEEGKGGDIRESTALRLTLILLIAILISFTTTTCR